MSQVDANQGLKPFQKEFIEFALEQGVLKFGEFQLKSGRTSPYFFNSGLFDTGLALAKLGQFYAQAIEASNLEFDIILGPAYKGIPLVSATSIALATQCDRDVPYVFKIVKKRKIMVKGDYGWEHLYRVKCSLLTMLLLQAQQLPKLWHYSVINLLK